MRHGIGFGVGGLVLVGILVQACGSSTSSDASGSGGGDATGTATSGGGGNGTGAGGSGAGGDAILGDAGPAAKLTIAPPSATLVAKGAPVIQAFQALSGGSSVAASWSFDDPALGTVDGKGTFTAAGTAGGEGTLTAKTASASATASVTVKLELTENPANLDAPTEAALAAGGNADAGFRFLYPYDGTVFPRGLAAPVLQLDGEPATAVRVQIASKYLAYDGYFAGGDPTQVTLPAATWKAVTASAKANDPVVVKVTKASASGVSGPIQQTWTIAQGSLKGTVYYNSYDSPLAGNTGATLKMKVGQPAAVLNGGCNVCHSVSANGNVLAEMHSDYVSGATYDLVNGGATMAEIGSTAFSFAAIYPDGSKLLSCGTLPGSWPPNVAGLSGNQDSKLYDPKTGAEIPAQGIDGLKALMPAFSPDGKRLAFNHYAVDSGHTLAVMDFDTGANTFSNLVDVVSGNPQYVGWPAFLPDGKTVLFEVGTSDQYRSDGGQLGDLWAVDVASKAAVSLDALGGLANGSPTLPYGAEDVHLNYEPTVLPVAVGGYSWVLFTSRRRYGNTITEAGQDSPRRKKLWVAAIDLSAPPGKDPSHPAFYLPDQELAAGNMRGFWALDPCKADGNDCESADECCGGYCRDVAPDGGAPSKQCVPPPSGCANEFEKCTQASDCCGAAQGFLCVNGHCAMPAPK